MTFNAYGYLEPGLHPMSPEEMKTAFVTGFPHSSTRPLIMEGYLRHYQALKHVVDGFQQFVDGSFVSNKNDPGDVDIVCFIDADTVDNLSVDDQLKLKALVAGKATKAIYHCDAYFALSCAPSHPAFSEARSVRKYWMGEFGFDRQETPKGIVLIEEMKSAKPEELQPDGAAGA